MFRAPTRFLRATDNLQDRNEQTALNRAALGHSQQIERAPKSVNVCFAPKATVSDQNVICR
jgi:hypothetical protein